MDKIKVVLFAMTGFGNSTFEALTKLPLVELIGVFTPKRQGTPFPHYECKKLQNIVEDSGIPLYEGLVLKEEETYQLIKRLSPEMIVVSSFNQIIPERIISIPRLGAINVHPSLLPRHRGATPTNWVICNGEKETGVTIHYLTNELDKGNILLQEKIAIDNNDTDGTLRCKLAILSKEMIIKVVKILRNGKIEGLRQDEDKASYIPKRAAEPLFIDFTIGGVQKIHNQIRSSLPFPGAFYLGEGGVKYLITSSLINHIIIRDKRKEFLQINFKAESAENGKLMYRGERITLRPFEKRDIERYREWINDGELASLIDRVLPVSEVEHEKCYLYLQENQNVVVFAIEVNQENKYIGNIWLWDIDYHHRKAEVRVIIGEKEYLA